MAVSQISFTVRPLFTILLILSFLVCYCEKAVAFVDDNLLATKASINGPSAIAVDEGGNLFIVESIENRVHRVDAKTGFITIVAGNGNNRHSGDGGLATQA